MLESNTMYNAAPLSDILANASAGVAGGDVDEMIESETFAATVAVALATIRVVVEYALESSPDSISTTR